MYKDTIRSNLNEISITDAQREDKEEIWLHILVAIILHDYKWKPSRVGHIYKRIGSKGCN